MIFNIEGAIYSCDGREEENRRNTDPDLKVYTVRKKILGYINSVSVLFDGWVQLST